LSILPIRIYGDPILRSKAETVEKVDETILNLINDMLETLRSAKGLGLAAPQVGYSLALFVIDSIPLGLGSDPIVLLNPKIVTEEGEDIKEEGCLSLPGINEEVKRPARIVVEGLNREGKGVRMEKEGLLARVLHHEVDHLEGILLIDRISPLRRELLKGRLKELKKSSNLKK